MKTKQKYWLIGIVISITLLLGGLSFLAYSNRDPYLVKERRSDGSIVFKRGGEGWFKLREGSNGEMIAIPTSTIEKTFYPYIKYLPIGKSVYKNGDIKIEICF